MMIVLEARMVQPALILSQMILERVIINDVNRLKNENYENGANKIYYFIPLMMTLLTLVVQKE